MLANQLWKGQVERNKSKTDSLLSLVKDSQLYWASGWRNCWVFTSRLGRLVGAGLVPTGQRWGEVRKKGRLCTAHSSQNLAMTAVPEEMEQASA